MPARDTFVDHVLDGLASVGQVTARRMFGGHGLYAGDVMFAIIAGDALYFKIDEDTRAIFEAAGARPFVYRSKGKTVAMSYYDAPADALEDPERLVHWADLALGAARRARRPSTRDARRRPSPRAGN